MNDVLLISEDTMLAHEPGHGHPERPDRLAAIRRSLSERPVTGTRWAIPNPCDVEALTRVHTARHVNRLLALRGRSAFLDPDTCASPRSIDAALLAAGAAVDAVTAVCQGEARRAFALVRPPGHHAEADAAMGFCFLNNVSIAAAHARAVLGCHRVLIVDWDVHHGNGTSHLFYERDDVLVFNTHQSPFYPGTGAVHESGTGAGDGFNVNVPLPAGVGDAVLLAAYRDLLGPIAEAFRPDLVIASAGFDAHRDDPLGGMIVTEAGFGALCGAVQEVAERWAGGRLMLCLEGGYHLGALAASVRACIEVLAGATPPTLPSTTDGPGQSALNVARATLRRFWKID